ncbi:MAG TPA: 1-acyl-sn-glycerol-3-phosphate acyltransferase, partial [Dehalococcoidia bacterium]|nr:1-acyl-sn-glycerol-3-phosphate acyltransferase [Dehalococcoidia bacterium]
LIVANHPTLIDIVFIIARVPNADCIVKSNLLRNPFMYGAISLSGYIASEDPSVVMSQAISSLKRGNNLVIFPEGTRSQRNAPLRFHRGAANIALRSAAPIRPIVIRCEPLTLGKGESWHHIPERPAHYDIIAQDIFVPQVSKMRGSTVQARQLTKQLQDYFSRERSSHGRITSRT